MMSNVNGQNFRFSKLAWQLPGQVWELGHFPKLMGIVNVTPDSFSDGGTFLDPGRAAAHALQLIEDGADLLDIGGESTRPGAIPITAAEENRRVQPVIKRLIGALSIPLSIDTTKADVASRALDAGAAIVNDISGLTADSGMPAVCAQSQCGVICMHMQGTPRTMQESPHYEDVVAEICEYLAGRIASLAEAGISPERVVIDPGIGFGKKSAHNIAILQNVDRLRAVGRPVLVGHSRKRFLARLLGRNIDELSAGTVGVSIGLALQGVDILRVHDVRTVRDAIAACWAVRAAIDPQFKE